MRYQSRLWPQSHHSRLPNVISFPKQLRSISEYRYIVLILLTFCISHFILHLHFCTSRYKRHHAFRITLPPNNSSPFPFRCRHQPSNSTSKPLEQPLDRRCFETQHPHFLRISYLSPPNPRSHSTGHSLYFISRRITVHR